MAFGLEPSAWGLRPAPCGLLPVSGLLFLVACGLWPVASETPGLLGVLWSTWPMRLGVAAGGCNWHAVPDRCLV